MYACVNAASFFLSPPPLPAGFMPLLAGFGPLQVVYRARVTVEVEIGSIRRGFCHEKSNKTGGIFLEFFCWRPVLGDADNITWFALFSNVPSVSSCSPLQKVCGTDRCCKSNLVSRAMFTEGRFLTRQSWLRCYIPSSLSQERSRDAPQQEDAGTQMKRKEAAR